MGQEFQISGNPDRRLEAIVRVPADKSIAHRGLLLGALARGTTVMHGVPPGQDVASTVACLAALGVAITRTPDSLIIEGQAGMLRPSSCPLDCGNSGTAMRLLLGLLAGQEGRHLLTGDASLTARPMDRVTDWLKQMGVRVSLTDGRFAPITLEGAGQGLRAIAANLPVASAQVKSALMLAALQAHGETVLTGKTLSRDHLERLFPVFGLRCFVESGRIVVPGRQAALAASLDVPGDISSAAAWIVAAAAASRSRVTITEVGLNPTRLGLVHVLQRMGAQIEMTLDRDFPEPTGTLVVEGGPLVAATVAADEVSSLVDEIPLLAVLACCARGRTRLEGIGELRFKETDRVEVLASGLSRMGIACTVGEDFLEIDGPQVLQGAVVDSCQDHRMAMAFAVAGLLAKGETTILSPDCVAISYPGFFETLKTVLGR